MEEKGQLQEGTSRNGLTWSSKRWQTSWRSGVVARMSHYCKRIVCETQTERERASERERERERERECVCVCL